MVSLLAEIHWCRILGVKSVIWISLPYLKIIKLNYEITLLASLESHMCFPCHVPVCIDHV